MKSTIVPDGLLVRRNGPRQTIGLAAALMTLLGVSTAVGEALITDLSTPIPFDFTNTGTIGYSFTTPSEPILVTQLGIWDDQQNGLASPAEIGLWSPAGALMRQVTIQSGTGSTLIGDFRYEPLADPILLPAGADFVLGAFRSPGVPYSALDTIEGVNFLVAPGVDVIEDRASSESGGEPTITFPGFVFDPNQALIGPNLIFTRVPEPATLASACFGAVGLLGGRRRITRG